MGSTWLDRALRSTAVLAIAATVLLATASPAGRPGQATADRSGEQHQPGTRDRPPGAPGEESDIGTGTRQATGPGSKPGPGFNYLLQDAGDALPGRWCGGTEIGYTIDFSQAVAAGMSRSAERARWRDTFADWSRASRGAYTFRYLGERRLRIIRTDGAREINLNSITPQTIGITYVYGSRADAAGHRQYLLPALRGRASGSAGIRVITRGTRPAAAMVAERGFIMIDAVDAMTLPPDGLRRALYRHEAGHSLGLGHVKRPGALMHATLGTARLDLSRGDIAGIRSLARMPCEP